MLLMSTSDDQFQIYTAENSSAAHHTHAHGHVFYFCYAGKITVRYQVGA